MASPATALTRPTVVQPPEEARTLVIGHGLRVAWRATRSGGIASLLGVTPAPGRDDARLVLEVRVDRPSLDLPAVDQHAPGPTSFLVRASCGIAGDLRDIPCEGWVTILATPTGRPVATGQRVVAARGQWRTDDALGLEHLDIPGVIAATFRRASPSDVSVLFVRSPLPARLGLSGGEYELAGAGLLRPGGDA